VRIVQVNVSEQGGGAEAVALALHEGFLTRGHDATLLVGRGVATRPGVRTFPADPVTSALHAVAGATRVVERARGIETFRYPATERALRAFETADIVHVHNLHGGYFDLRVLAQLSRSTTVTMTLHDAWLLSGHCAHSLGCERWRTGCGACPDLGIYPAVRRDATALNWQRKADIFRRSRLHVVTPSRWLADRVRGSMLDPAVVDLRVIPNGIDLDVFTTGNRAHARRALGLPADTPVVLVLGAAAANPFKDTATAFAAVAHAAELRGSPITLVQVGGDDVGHPPGSVHVVRHAFEQDPRRLALHYQAADVYVHAAHADTFPTAVLEAMACGTPVVATATGGIPEQIRNLDGDGPPGAADHADGILAEPGNSAALGSALALLIGNTELRRTLGANAAARARRDYGGDDQCDAYLEWYRSLQPAGALS
jgi:glycosyltransferase involved in cell wall biosynthesis